jgi:hypothetical protein
MRHQHPALSLWSCNGEVNDAEYILIYGGPGRGAGHRHPKVDLWDGPMLVWGACGKEVT